MPHGRLTSEPSGELGATHKNNEIDSTTMDGIPAPLVTGSIAYLVLAVVLIGLSLGSLATGFQTKDNVA
jgi:hypothetical protein